MPEKLCFSEQETTNEMSGVLYGETWKTKTRVTAILAQEEKQTHIHENIPLASFKRNEAAGLCGIQGGDDAPAGRRQQQQVADIWQDSHNPCNNPRCSFSLRSRLSCL